MKQLGFFFYFVVLDLIKLAVSKTDRCSLRIDVYVDESTLKGRALGFTVRPT